MNNLYYTPYSEFTRVRDLSGPATARAALFATLCRINTLYMVKNAGSGHIGSSFSAIDIMSWLFLNILRVDESNGAAKPIDVFFSSKGHDGPAFYSVMIGMGLLDFNLIHHLRKLGGLPGHPDIATPFVQTNTGSLGMGISKAKGMVLANRLQGRDEMIYVLTGDGELQEGQIWESLQSVANLELGEITVIVDHNKIQSDTYVSNVSDLGNLEAKFSGFGWRVSRCNGNSYEDLSNELTPGKSRETTPHVIIADTVKGRGITAMEHTSMAPGEVFYRFHSGAPDDNAYADGVAELIETANRQLKDLGSGPLRLESTISEARPSTDKSQHLVRAYSKALIKNAEANSNIVALDADLILDTGLVPFRDKFPDRFFECGIAEQDMVSQAGGMALKGLLPIVHSFACFLSARPNEQIYNNATEAKKIIYVGSLAGILPGGTGHSHQCVRDISALGAIPGLVMIEPSCELEVDMAVDFCAAGTLDSYYLRLVSIPCKVPYKLNVDYRLEFGRGASITEGADIILFGYGPILLSQAYEASELLAQRGIGLKVINLPWLNRVDSNWLRDTVTGYKRVFTLDNHYVSGGQGDMILSQIASLGLKHPPICQKLGIRFIPECGTNDEVLRAHKLDSESLSEEIARAMEE